MPLFVAAAPESHISAWANCKLMAMAGMWIVGEREGASARKSFGWTQTYADRVR